MRYFNLDREKFLYMSFIQKDEAIFTFRDKPKIGKVDTKTFKKTYIDIKEPIEDFL